MKGVDLDSAAYGFRPDAVNTKPLKQSKTKEKSSSFFSLFAPKEEDSNLSELEDREVMLLHVEKTLDEIHELGDKLSKHPAPETISQYKKAIKGLMQLFQEKGLKTERQVSTRNVLEQKQYQVIKVIDEKLEKLVVGILQSQYNQLEILAKVEEIQGLLVNLLY